MPYRIIKLTGWMTCTLATMAMPAAVASNDAPATNDPAAWQTPATDRVVSAVTDWVRSSAPSPRIAEERIAASETLLNQLSGPTDRLDVVMTSLAAHSAPIAELIATAQQPAPNFGTMEWLESADLPEFVRSNVRLYLGRSLVRRGLYEEALTELQKCQLADVVDPAGLLFYQSIAEHQLVQLEPAKKSLDSLLESNEVLPERYVQVARLMKADIAKVEKDSLDHIARRMSDVRRRLGLGESDERAQEVERGILASLDKMIEDLEEQQKKQQQQQMPGGQPSGTPMEESQIAETKGDGKVDLKELGKTAGWGDLPPRERERVLQQIGRDFPGHYRDLMEQYLKRLATDEREESQP